MVPRYSYFPMSRFKNVVFPLPFLPTKPSFQSVSDLKTYIFKNGVGAGWEEKVRCSAFIIDIMCTSGKKMRAAGKQILRLIINLPLKDSGIYFSEWTDIRLSCSRRTDTVNKMWYSGVIL